MNTIKELRISKKLSQNELAKKLNVSKRIIQDWENNRRNPSEYNYKKLSSFFNVPIDILKAQIIISDDKNKIKSVLKDNTTGNYQIIFNQKVENTKDPLLKIKLDEVIKNYQNYLYLEYMDGINFNDSNKITINTRISLNIVNNANYWNCYWRFCNARNKLQLY